MQNLVAAADAEEPTLSTQLLRDFKGEAIDTMR
jgi:hypothetical protein